MLSLNCPHCRTERAMFHPIGTDPNGVAPENVTAFYRCAICKLPVILNVRMPNGRGAGLDFSRTPEAQGGVIMNVWPEPKELAAPEHVPDIVARFFVQGLSAEARADFDAAGMMFRKSLEAAIRAREPELTGGLYQRIEALAARQTITPALVELAHQIRQLGNAAAHDADEFSRADAGALGEFTKLFLLYSYTLPAKIALQKQSGASE